jgi:hypothetical protein
MEQVATRAEQRSSEVEAQTRQALKAAQRAEDEERKLRAKFEEANVRAAELMRVLSQRNVSELGVNDVCDVLRELNLGGHAHKFKSNDIDGALLKKLNDERLKKLGVNTAAERQKLKHAMCMIEACGQLRLTASAIERIGSLAASEAERDALMIVTWPASHVATWLEANKVSQRVREKLLAAQVSGERVLHMTDEDLEQLGITSMGEQIRLMELVDATRKRHFAVLETFFNARIQQSAPSATPTTTTAAAVAGTPYGATVCSAGDGTSAAPPSEYLCPITLELMEQPVVAPDGNVYEESAIRQWLAAHKTSPMTGAPMTTEPLLRCNTLRSAIIGWKEKHPQYKQR